MDFVRNLLADHTDSVAHNLLADHTGSTDHSLPDHKRRTDKILDNKSIAMLNMAY